MGSSNSAKTESRYFNINEWVVQENEQEYQEANSHVSLKNINSGEIIHRYHVDLLSENDYKIYIECLQWRKNEPFLVKVYHYQTHQKREFCSTSYSVTVYLSSIKGRLSQFKDIPYPDNLYCMMAMLEGYSQLHDKIGRFYVCQEQVCIDENGQIRVWLNSDLCKNFPQAEPYEQGDNYLDEEGIMVDEILDMIINNTDESVGPSMKFPDYYQKEKYNRNNQVSFEDAKTIINDYARMNQIQIPDVFKSVLEMYQNGENDEEEFLPNELNHQMPPINLPHEYEEERNRNNFLSPQLANQFVQTRGSRNGQVQQSITQPMNPIGTPSNRQVINNPVPPMNFYQPNIQNQVIHHPSQIPIRPPHHNVQSIPLNMASNFIQPPPLHHHNSMNINRSIPHPHHQSHPHPNIVEGRPLNIINSQRQPINTVIPPSHQTPTPHFFSPQQKQYNPFQMIKGNQIQQVINKNNFHQNEHQIERAEDHLLKYNSRQREQFQDQSNQQEEEYEEKYEEEIRDDEFKRRNYDDEVPILKDLAHLKRMTDQEEENLFDQILEEKKVTQSQAYQIQESQHSANGQAKYSAPSSQIYQYHSMQGNQMNRNQQGFSGLATVSKKGKLQYYTVEEPQELDPEIAADLLLYT